MTPTTPLAGVIFGLVAGLVLIALVALVLYVPWRRPVRIKVPVRTSRDPRRSETRGEPRP